MSRRDRPPKPTRQASFDPFSRDEEDVNDELSASFSQAQWDLGHSAPQRDLTSRTFSQRSRSQMSYSVSAANTGSYISQNQTGLNSQFSNAGSHSTDYYPTHEDTNTVAASKKKRSGGADPGVYMHHGIEPRTRRINSRNMFQNVAFGVEVRSIDLNNKVAFEKTSIVPREYRLSDVGKNGQICSPSLLHYEALERIHGQRFVRQLAWKPSVSYDAVCTTDNNESNANPQLVNVHEYLRSLPNNPPSIHKYRLPMRCDVGFPNTSDSEMQLKQEEICMMAEHEEVQPRLLLLGNQFLRRTKSEIGVKGSFNSKYSLFAPPLDSFPSSSKLWRPRPFNDRPPGMIYLVASALDIVVESSNEPLVGTLSLYSILDRNDSKSFRGRISEDFIFPVGNWDGLLKEEASRFIQESLFGSASMGSNFSDDPKEKRKKKALFCFDPLNVPNSDKSLVVVIQLFRISQPVICKRKKSMFSGSNRKTNSVSSAKSVFSKFGTQFLTPFCFGVAPVSKGTNCNVKWPKGETKKIPLYTYSKTSESDEMFTEHISSIAKPSTGSVQSKLLEGSTVRLFTSFLGPDFCQVLQQCPRELSCPPSDNSPRLLVDTTGDGAIMINPENNSHKAKSRRSDLVRLPPSPRPSGYLDSFEIKEVIYFPPPRSGENDSLVPLASYCFLNVMYLYPKYILVPKNFDRSDKLLSLRVRLIQQNIVSDELGSSETIRTTIDSIFNPAPGRPILQAVYTKISPAQCKQGENCLYLRDEIKLRLPAILDNSFFIQFSLFSVQVNELNAGGITAEVLSENLIPLSRTTEPSYKYQVTTIIPNGLHSLRLGDFKVHFETKVASSIHVSDPSIATMFCHSAEQGKISRSGSMEHDPFNLSYTDILEKASPFSVVNYFRELVFLHLFQLVKSNHPDPDNMNAIFEIILKAKAVHGNSSKLGIFFKSFVDNFDEMSFYLQPRDMAVVNNRGSVIDSSSFFNIDADDDNSVSNYGQDDLLTEAAVEAVENMLLEAAIYVISFQHSRSNVVNLTRSNTFSSTKEPYTRKVYGASKIEQMRAEAETNNDDRAAQYFDDGSDRSEHSSYTTNIQNHSYENSSMVRDMYTFEDTSKIDHNTTYGSRTRNSSVQKMSALSSIRHTIQKNRWSKTVTNIAQVAVAPCVAPVFAADAIFRRGRGKSVEIPVESEIAEKPIQLYSAGSDLDDEDDVLINAKKLSVFCDNRVGYRPCDIPFFSYPGPSKIRGIFTVLGNAMPFSLSIDGLSERSQIENGNTYVYECIFSLWINAWQDHKIPSRRHLSGTNTVSIHSFFSNIDFLLPLCLKSLTLRLSTSSVGNMSEDIEVSVPFILDANHIKVLLLLMDVLAFGALRYSIKNHQEVLSSSCGQYIQICDETCDFLVGLLALVHSSQVSLLIERYFTTLFICEFDESESLKLDFSTGWRRVLNYFGKNKPIQVAPDSPPSKFIRMNASRKLRLRTTEKLAIIPGFVAINYPLRYTSQRKKKLSLHASWTHQLLDEDDEGISCPYNDGADRLPRSHWLAELLISETMRICSESLEWISNSSDQKSLFCEKIANDAITVFYEYILKRHSLDKRFQGDIAKTRIAGMFAVPFFEMTCSEVSRLMKVPATNNIRCLWLLCFLHVCQDAPEQMIRDYLRHSSLSTDAKIHIFTRVLKMCTLSFQEYIGVTSSGIGGFVNDVSWLVQESFNTICATIILVVDECSDILLSDTLGRIKIAQGIFDLILFILTTPQSTITQARALGAACLSMEKFGVPIFLEVIGDNMQHWARVLLALLNSIELSVRSVSIDLIISIFGGAYDENGSVDDVSLVFLTVLPEVIAREVAQYTLTGHIKNLEDIARCLWPLRRGLGEIEGTDPNDDERIDVQLNPILATFCQACQAITDGVLIELRLQGDTCSIAGTKITMKKYDQSGKSSDNNGINMHFSFDADEESLFEAASIFTAETSPMQRLRWLLTLKKLHESKGQWIEAAESSLLCAKTISDAIPFISNIWRPSLFTLWRDIKRSPWLPTLAKANESVRRIHEMIQFSENFLESPTLLLNGALKEQASSLQSTLHGKLYHPTIPSLCNMLKIMSDEAVKNYSEEGPHTEMLASIRIEQLLRNVMDVIDQHSSSTIVQDRNDRKQRADSNAALRRVSTHVNLLLARLAESMAKDTSALENSAPSGSSNAFVRVSLLGKKPHRFEEASTSIPSFIEWENVYICRIKHSILEKATKQKNFIASSTSVEDNICEAFAQPILATINAERDINPAIFCTKPPSEARLAKEGASRTFVVVTPVKMSTAGATKATSSKAFDKVSISDGVQSKRFFSKNELDAGRKMATIIESTVAHCFPCALSRQRAIITTEYVPGR